MDSKSMISAALQLDTSPSRSPLFATGLGVMGLFGWRRKQKSA